MKLKILLLTTFTSLLALPSHANIRQYQADLEDSMWKVSEASRLNCTLSHNIPNYGEARFSSTASRKLTMDFELDMLRLPDSYSFMK